MDPSTIYQNVKDRYTATALAPSHPNYGNAVAQAFGYSAEDLASIPADSNLGLSCGNPLALAHLQPGETIIDLGSGAGFDCFLATNKVGETGRVIGVDMNEDMLAKARRNAEKSGKDNIVSFVYSLITEIQLPSATADVIISNCVINLVPHAEKNSVFKEMYRLLRPGGRVAISDILLKKDLPEQMKNDVALYVGCVAGASRKEDYEMWLSEAGFGDVMVVDAKTDLNVYTRTEDGESMGSVCCGPVEKTEEEEGDGCCKPAKVEEKSAASACCGTDKGDGGVVQDVKTNFRDVDLNEWAGSYKIFAVKAA
ncbi:SAM-dependent methyltransferase UbiE/COQ5 family protein [Periconia macrospinosa]|uniref:Arsenite methyltransferase n=1 Tax=Periconia macrospinosa TaxID=97972 RepID=A0A2V1DL64_9PLEO|nr:SAM-dependent methyltransferase UbiE/COQ5 family protein [Periconia macrospinosa]